MADTNDLLRFVDLDLQDVLNTLTGEGYVRLGAGHFATILGREGEQAVYRLSSVVDGWAGYAVGIASESLEDDRYAPRIHGMVPLRSGYLALTERLHPPRSEAEAELDRRIRLALARPAEEDVRDIEGLGAFVSEACRYLGRTYLDPTEGNVLFRHDGHPVVNDPCGRTFEAGSGFPTFLRHFWRESLSEQVRPPIDGQAGRSGS